MAQHTPVIDALNAAFGHKYNSLARYILDANPYVRPGQEAGLGELATIAASDSELADRLAVVIERLEGIPQISIFDPQVANLNYLALEHLVPVLADSLRAQLAQFEAGLAVAEADEEAPAAVEVFQRLIAVTRAQLQRLAPASAS